MKILIAWWFWFTNQHDDLAQERLKVCVKCKSRKWFVCGECGCPLQAKTRLIEEKCPLGKW